MSKYSNELQNLQIFFESYTIHEQKLNSQRIEKDIHNFKEFFIPFEKLMLDVEKKLKATAPKYNVFDVINLNYLETKLHTPFLVHLLNPKANHEQKRLFFDLFLKSTFGNTFNTSGISHINIYEEFSGTFGRIDILILFQYEGRKKAIVIENKIYHHDGDQQLQRYYDHLTKDRRLKDGDYFIVYLTPNKTIPTAYSISIEIYKKLKHQNAIFELGYKDDIKQILVEALKEIEAEPLKQILYQYIKTIELL